MQEERPENTRGHHEGNDRTVRPSVVQLVDPFLRALPGPLRRGLSSPVQPRRVGPEVLLRARHRRVQAVLVRRMHVRLPEHLPRQGDVPESLRASELVPDGGLWDAKLLFSIPSRAKRRLPGRTKRRKGQLAMPRAGQSR